MRRIDEEEEEREQKKKTALKRKELWSSKINDSFAKISNLDLFLFSDFLAVSFHQN